MRRTSLCLIFGVSLLWAGIAGAAPPQLKGQYAFTGEMTCITSLDPKQARLESSIIVGPGASRIITDKKNYS